MILTLWLITIKTKDKKQKPGNIFIAYPDHQLENLVVVLFAKTKSIGPSA
jgi:hypothetical protein